MRITYESLVKPSLKIMSLSAVLFMIAVLSLSVISIYYNVQMYGIDVIQLALFIVSMFIVFVLIVVAKVLSASSSLNPGEFIASIRISMIMIYISLINFNILGILVDIPLDSVGIPPYIALYLLILILSFVSFILMKRHTSSTEEKGLLVAGTIIDVASVSIALVVLMYILGGIFRNALMLIYMSGSLALALFIWIDLENMISKIVGKTNTLVLWSIISRRVATAIIGIILGSVILYYNALAIAEMTNYPWSFASLIETFYLLLLTSLVIMLIALLVGLIGGVIFIPSNHGVKGLVLLTRRSRGESIDLSILGISVSTETPTQGYGVTEKPSESTTMLSTATVQAQETTVEVGSSKQRCSYCGRELPANANFCPHCGAYLAADEGTRVYAESK